MKARILVVVARLHQQLGAMGLLGVGLLCAAAVTLGMAWRSHQQGLAIAAAPVPVAPAVRPTAMPARLPLPDGSDIPSLLNRIQRTAVEQRLGWPRADYRINAASAEAPASLEVHCTLKGPYPSLRRFVTALLQDAPALTLREFALSRPSADVAEVEAKLAIMVYLASESHP